LSDNQTTKELKFRLLPIDGTSNTPFKKIHVHTVKVPKEVSPSGWKSYICIEKTEGIDRNIYGSKCPFCEMNREAYKKFSEETEPAIKERWKKISLENIPKEACIVRGIERGAEEDGPKFWKFNIRSDKTDPYNQILKLVNLRKENAERKGKVENILDIYNGRDLTITFTEGSTSAPTIVDDMDRSPLSENEELMRQWIFDSKRWQDVFTCKPYEYLSLVAQMRTPWFDRANGVWVDKDEFEDKNKKKTEDIDSDINAAKNAVLNPNTEQTSGRESNNGTSDFVDSLMLKDDEDNMPF
jgi:hypothetical protein